MKNLVEPPKRRLNRGLQDDKWGPAIAAIIAGKVIRISGVSQPWVQGGLKRLWIINQGYMVHTKTLGTDVLAWIAPGKPGKPRRRAR